jgi:predicted dehydrogenase
MRQILQSLSTGKVDLIDMPRPSLQKGKMLIATRRTLVSAGTERMLVEFGRGGLLAKARQQPDKVREVLDKMRTDGLLTTLDAVRSKLDQPLALGYCNAGVVLDVGEGVTGFKPGDRVASNGAHAELVSIGQNLAARIPENVDDDAAAFTVLGAIALQGVRLAAPTLGECVVVTGLGLIGLMAVQLLRAQGCRVLGIDPDPAKVALAAQFGAETVCPSRGEDPLARAESFSRGRGVDAVLITASTKSNEPVHQGAQMCRKRGRIVLVGVTGLELSRADFYEKELSFQVSCSYGPGRYDPAYEEKGQDYPVGFVRWTEQRNFEAVLDMMASGVLDVAPLISHHFALEQAAAAYELLVSDEPKLGIVIDYPKQADESRAIVPLLDTGRAGSGEITSVQHEPVVSFIGAGNYAGRVLIPAFARAGTKFGALASSGGASSVYHGRKFGFARAATDVEAVLADEAADAVVIATRHDSHADLVCRALSQGKHVFVEKPLALTYAELEAIEAARGQAAAKGTAPLLMVGFNRRFAPQVEKMRALLRSVDAPKSFIVTVNAGAIPPEHWTQDTATGGGRIIGEACHFVDLMRALADAPITSVVASALPRQDKVPPDTVSFTLGFADGSIGTVHYFANGHRSFPKERVEVFCGGRVLMLDNFRRLTGFGWPGFRKHCLWRQDKGQEAAARAFLQGVRAGKAPVHFEEVMEISRVTLDVAVAVSGRKQG